MDGYRQTLLGRSLADALHDIEMNCGDADVDRHVNGDLIFSLFDEAMMFELHDKRNAQTYTHDLLQLTGEVTAFNRFVDDWSVLACVKSHEIHLNRSVAIFHLRQQSQDHEKEQGIAVRLKLRKIAKNANKEVQSSK
ncbi:hypothetical protein CCR75_006723 [Bremia lactucae]|uniref:Uncharacterized protein n=1 Tax=Bremia lactucae TaxID=4779 RepID=A0A976IKK5_BRELC|nr:hypothetical protein CCR75_006723 [Bremia lactucae]